MTDRQKLKILIPVLGFGKHGGNRVLSELAKHFALQGHECTFLVPATSPPPYFPTTGKIIRFDSSGIEHAEQIEKRQNGLDNLFSLWKGLKAVGGRFDIVLANHSLTAWPVRFAMTQEVFKFYYIQAHEPVYYPLFRSPVKKLLAIGSYHLGLRMIANATTYPINPAKIEAVIAPGVDLQIFAERPEGASLAGGGTKKLGTIGRSEPYKGTETALRAYRILRKEGHDISLSVAIGNVQKADDLNIVPIHSDNDLACFYKSIDILLVACRGQRGAPHYPIIEAMACGAAVVHTGYYPGTSENSWLAEGTSSQDVAKTLRTLLNTPRRDIEEKTKKARKDVERELAWPAVAAKFIDCFMSDLAVASRGKARHVKPK